MVCCDDRLISVTDLLHLFPKMACLIFKTLQRAWQGERAGMGKMCSHGPWEIPPLFEITVTFQNSAASVIPVKEQTRVILLSHQ